MKKKMLVRSIIAASVVAVGLLTTNAVLAQESSSYPLIVQRIAERFNLNEADVALVFDEVQDEHHSQMRFNLEEKLSDSVANGQITEGQKEAILVKHDEMHDKMQELDDLSHEERHARMREMHEDLRTWAEENNIDLQQFGPFGKGFKQGFRAGYHLGVSQ